MALGQWYGALKIAEKRAPNGDVAMTEIMLVSQALLEAVARVAELEAALTRQPIETAPKDGKRSEDKGGVMMDDITAKKIERIYGLLWNARTDRTTFSGVAVSEARKIALSMIDKDGQASGIEWAVREIPKVLDDQR